MLKILTLQGRDLTPDDIETVRSLLLLHPDWSRRRVSIALAEEWNWRTPSGQLKDMAARSLLLKLEERGLIQLPPRRSSGGRQIPVLPSVPAPTVALPTSLASLMPLSFVPIRPGTEASSRFRAYLSIYHYLGYSGPVGQNLGYLVCDREGRDLACVLFGAAAWKTAPRDLFVGWNESQRKAGLPFVVNNSRFLILPWVQVPHLASHVLGRVLRRLPRDWQDKYQQPLFLVETFVEKERFAGTCYRAANWICVGETQGRSRQDRDRTLQVPVKTVYLFPLHRDFRRRLCC